MSLIVVGFDGSDRSHDALALARELAEPAGAELLLATAVPYPALALVGEGIAVAVTREGAAAGARRLDQEIAALAADGLRRRRRRPALRLGATAPAGARAGARRGADRRRIGILGPARTGPAGHDRRAPAGRGSVSRRRRPVRSPPRGPRPGAPHRCRVRRIRRGARCARGGRGHGVEPRRHARGDRGARRVPLRRARAHGRSRLPPHARGRRGRCARPARHRARRPAPGDLRARRPARRATPRGSWSSAAATCTS